MTTENWKEHPKLEGLLVSDQGRVAIIKEGSVVKVDDSRRVYHHGLNLQVHRLVCETWHDRRPLHMKSERVWHINGDKSDNRAENVQWRQVWEYEFIKGVQDRHMDKKF